MGCRRTATPAELVRVVRGSDGSLAVGRTLPGRGAWLCADSDACFDLAARRRSFERALRATVEPSALSVLRARLYPGN